MKIFFYIFLFLLKTLIFNIQFYQYSFPRKYSISFLAYLDDKFLQTKSIYYHIEMFTCKQCHIQVVSHP